MIINIRVYRVSQNLRIPNSEHWRDHFSSPNMEKKIGTPPTKIHWSEGALFQVQKFKYRLKRSVFIVIMV
jgi:hypothetical protein